MSKKIIALTMIIVVIIIGLICVVTINKSKKANNIQYITDSDYLYDVAIEFIKKEYLELQPERKEKNDYQIFLDYTPFGISKDGDYKYAYMWIVDEAHYVENGVVTEGAGSSMAYKFKFQNDEVVDYEIPDDGMNYTDSLKKMFPDDIEDKIINYTLDDTELNRKVEEHYSYLKND